MISFKQIVAESFLLEISLLDHYTKFVEPKIRMSVGEYIELAELDPTTRSNLRGKYVDWLIKILINPETGDWKDPRPMRGDVENALIDFIKKPVDINQFKTFQALLDYVNTIPDKSTKEQKDDDKNIFKQTDDIKIIDVTDEWIIAQPLSHKGNILLARYKSDISAKWCTADPLTSTHWDQYDSTGMVICFLHKTNRHEKYQIYIVDQRIKESKDFDNQEDDTPRDIIKNNPNIIGEIKEFNPIGYELDEMGIALYILSDSFYEQEHDYLTREPEEDEVDTYNNNIDDNIVYQIDNWDTLINNGLDIFEDSYKSEYWSRSDNVDVFVKLFRNPPRLYGELPTGQDKTLASNAVYNFYKQIEKKWSSYIQEPQNDDAPS